MATDARIAATAVAQAGAFTRVQATAAGFSPAQIERRVRAGVWRRLLPRVYCHGATPVSIATTRWAAVLWAGPDCALSHSTAAALWHIRVPPATRPELIVPKRRAPRVGGVVVHRVARISAPDVGRAGRLPVTVPVRTIIDLAAFLCAADLEIAIASACLGGLLTVRALKGGLDEIGSGGRPGAAGLRALLVTLGSGGVGRSARMAG